MKFDDQIKLFCWSHALAERDLDKVEKDFLVDLGRKVSDEKDEEYYPQFPSSLRHEANQMSKQYELFYCLEKSIRSLVSETLASQHGENWWVSHAPRAVRESADGNIERERHSGVTLRSSAEIDYTTFGELGEIVRANWAAFDAIFSSDKAFTKIMTSLNMLRAPIAHCCPLAEDEVLRLKLAVKDWFRLME